MIQAQYMTLCAMSICGAMLGSVYDAYRIILNEWKLSRWLGPLVDFLFWIFAFVLVLGALWWADDGTLRVYTFILLALGYGLYFVLLRALVRAGTLTFARIVVFIAHIVAKLITLVFVSPIILLWRGFVSTSRILYGILLTIEPILLWPLRTLEALLRFALYPLARLTAPYWMRGKAIVNRLWRWIWAGRDTGDDDL